MVGVIGVVVIECMPLKSTGNEDQTLFYLFLQSFPSDSIVRNKSMLLWACQLNQQYSKVFCATRALAICCAAEKRRASIHGINIGDTENRHHLVAFATFGGILLPNNLFGFSPTAAVADGARYSMKLVCTKMSCGEQANMVTWHTHSNQHKHIRMLHLLTYL